ncbi:selenide, water dikinase SelD [Pantanalinema rosaneae CENA516]|uniref:selenide, water dikinase SelD n=1 Tax=Pantanalinema rosaneae TaxID=1620701 RepID=UPI003D6ECC9F
MKPQVQPVSQDLVLIGGGHSHAIALRLLAMHPLSGVRLTLISEASDTPYSGMLPGYVAGFYSYDDCHIDLRALAQFAGAQFYVDQAIGLDLDNHQVLCAHRPPVAFDLLSIDIGSTPAISTELTDLDWVLPAKPIRRFLEKWNQLVQSIQQHPDQPICIAIVGGGVGGVELAFNIQQHLHQILQAAEQPLSHLTLHLVHRDADLLPSHNRCVRDRVRRLLSQRGIHYHLQQQVTTVHDRQLHCESGFTLACDYVIWVTQASAPNWLAKAGLAVNQDGFILVNDSLQSVSHPQVFAAGDVATMINHPRPKAGVFAVRQGKPLSQNWQRALQHQPLQRFYPQQQFLTLIGTGNGSAIASRGMLAGESPLLWRWKDWIDRRFMQRFSHLPPMSPPSSLTPPSPLPCAGCGSKVGSSVLERVLTRIQPEQPQVNRDTILIGLDAPDDAAVIQVPVGMVMAQTIDYFTALINDPFVFGQISANHALSDLIAMGASPHSALAIATIPYGTPTKVEETLYQLLSGAIAVLQQSHTVLIGGHTTEGSELALGFSCNGWLAPDGILRKGGMLPGQMLILTKALGTGTLFAAQMQRQAKGRWIDQAVDSMLQSNQAAAQCFMQHQATACTDVTGFGLLGHLGEMMRAAKVAVNLQLDAIPTLAGALETSQQGIVSSLYAQNLQASPAIANLEFATTHPNFPLLFDPQTSGGLLASVPADRAHACLTALHQLGYRQSAIVGEILPTDISTPASQVRVIA